MITAAKRLHPTLDAEQRFDQKRGLSKRPAWGTTQILAQEKKNRNSPRPSMAPLPRRGG